jgi:hypothetical protein
MAVDVTGRRQGCAYRASTARVDVWTLDQGMERWHDRMNAVVATGVDMITTTTAPVLARAFRDQAPGSIAQVRHGAP